MRASKLSVSILVMLSLVCSWAKLLTLQIPQATVHSSLVAEAWFAWHSMPFEEVVSIGPVPLGQCPIHQTQTYKGP
jgi:hypothetical protein